ncbi:MAG: alpha/beta hydrolase [Flavipsychrobacter sp.]|nr:alpha/beta hydrolase [Flavipsychrobacter sp.]
MKKINAILITLLFVMLQYHLVAQGIPTLNANICGKGNQTIIFIPGFACSGDVWKETVAGYEKSNRCIVLTMPGIAGVPPLQTATISYWEKIIADYIIDHKIDHPIIVGHSMGGVLALTLAADHPDLVSKIVVVDALPCLSALSNPTFKTKENNDCGSTIAMMTGMNDDQFYNMQVGMLPRLVADTTRVKTIAHWGITSDRKTLGEIYCDFQNTDVREKITEIHCPTLVLLEPSFANIKPAIEEQYKNLKGAQLMYAAKGLHFIMYDDMEWYNKQLAAFIK